MDARDRRDAESPSMIIYDYIVRPDGELHRLRQTDTATLAPTALDLCREFMAGAPIPGDIGLVADWEEHATYAGVRLATPAGVPISYTAVLPARDDDILGMLHTGMIRMLHGTPIEPGDSWTDLIYDYPAVITLVWPSPKPAAHMMAGDLSRCWAAAWLLDREDSDHA